MKSEQLIAQPGGDWQPSSNLGQADLVIYFGLREALEDGRLFKALQQRYPEAAVVGCSTGGQILDDDVSDDTATAVALDFNTTSVKLSVQKVTDNGTSDEYGKAIGSELAGPDLAGIFLLSDGLSVNGSELTAGVIDEVGPEISLSGGLAGDGSAFQKTLVGGNAPPAEKVIVGIGFYGPDIKVHTGSNGGWDQFGPRRTITRSEGNVLYELDGRPALDLYERYLGDEAAGLPGTALLFPLKIMDPERPDHDIVRTILSVDKDARTMTFAGNMPQGWMAQLMRGRFSELAAGSGDAARQACYGAKQENALALLVSCIGRRLLMGQMIADEIEAAIDEIGPNNAIMGFYSYGEIAPHKVSRIAELHNQTMTITMISESA